jgi:Zn-dependent M28 family amino/carboxypeptidase
LDLGGVKERADLGGPAMEVGPITIARSHEIDRVPSWNILGVLPGSDPNLKDEAVLYIAHLDHLGVGEPDEDGDMIFNGAHDNALGVARTLAAAEALVGLEPRRSIVFLTLGAEEKGHLGSWYYVRNPAVPIERSAAAINQDGGSSGPPVDDFMSVGGDYSTLGEIIREAARLENMAVADEILPPLAGRSTPLLLSTDHREFLMAGVPAVYLMEGFSVGGDPEIGQQWWESFVRNTLHKQSDNFSEEWDLGNTIRMARVSARLGWALANQDELPRFKEDALMNRPRGIPTEPYVFREDHPLVAGTEGSN